MLNLPIRVSILSILVFMLSHCISKNESEESGIYGHYRDSSSADISVNSYTGRARYLDLKSNGTFTLNDSGFDESESRCSFVECHGNQKVLGDSLIQISNGICRDRLSNTDCRDSLSSWSQPASVDMVIQNVSLDSFQYFMRYSPSMLPAWRTFRRLP